MVFSSIMRINQPAFCKERSSSNFGIADYFDLFLNVNIFDNADVKLSACMSALRDLVVNSRALQRLYITFKY